MKEYHLELNEDKTCIVEFGKDKGNTFDFLGFTLYWGRTREAIRLKVKTSADKLRKAIAEFKLWIKTNRNRYKLRELWRMASEKMRGHYAYYGNTVNNKLGFYYFVCTQLLQKWLNRRSAGTTPAFTSWVTDTVGRFPKRVHKRGGRLG